MSASVESTPVIFTAGVSNKAQWTGRILSGIAVLFLLFDAIGKLMQPEAVVKGTAELGWPADVILTLGILQVICLIAYLIPRTAVLGAILWTGYLGGAIATHVRIGEGFLPPVILGILLWGGLWLRDTRVRALLPFRAAK